MRNKLLLVSALLCLSAPTANAGGLTAKSLEALKKYCIPDPAVVTEASTTVCGSIFEGQYDTRLKKCKCVHDKNLEWDPVLRRCKVKCTIPGTHPKILQDNSQEGNRNANRCPAGYWPKEKIQK